MNRIERSDVIGPVEAVVLPQAPRRATASPNMVLAIVCVGICLANLDLFIVNVALPNIGRDFEDTSLEDMSWVLNGYAIAYAALLVFFGRLAERHPRNLSFLLGVGLFTAASAACAVANNVETLIAFRVVQAAGAALMTPTSLGLLLAVFAPEKRGTAVRTWTAIGGLAAALGPVVGGLLVTVKLALDFHRQRSDRSHRHADRLVEAAGDTGPRSAPAERIRCGFGDRWHRRAHLRHRESERLGIGRRAASVSACWPRSCFWRCSSGAA